MLSKQLDLSKFRSWLIVKRGIGKVCADGYCGSVRRFIKATGIACPTEDDAIAYMLPFYERGYSYNHIVNTSLGIEALSQYNGMPFRLGRPRKPVRIVRDTLSETEVARMICFCRNVREKALISVLAYSGIRNLELCHLKVGEVNLVEQVVTVIGGKGDKDGVCCIAPACVQTLKEYLTVHPRHQDQTLFFSIARNKAQDGLQTGAVRKHVKVIAKRAGIKKRVYPHLFRHSLATNLLLKGSDIYTVQKQLRHSFVESSLVYIQSNPSIMRNRYAIFAPQYTWGV